MNISNYIRDITDFPKKGIIFKDITTLLNNKSCFSYILHKFRDRLINKKIDQVIGIESRGFILGAPLALLLGSGFIPVRKKGKLPYKKFSEKYDLEYGLDVLEIHIDAIKKKDNVIIIDDVLATGGTIEAAIKLVRNFDVNIIECQFLLELTNLKGSKKINSKNIDFFSMIKVN